MRLAGAALAALLAGCASTKVDSTGSAPREPICRAGDAPLETAIFWAPKWRPDQKEPALREEAARRGIEAFARGTPCLAVTRLERLADPDAGTGDLLRLAESGGRRPDRAVRIVVRELGPRLTIGFPLLVEGETEAVLEIRVLDARTSAMLSDGRTHWRNGGTLVVKGVATLEDDMRSALAAALLPVAAPLR